MEKSFLEYFKRFKFLSLGDLRLVHGIIKVKKIKAGDLIINEGDMFHFATTLIILILSCTHKKRANQWLALSNICNQSSLKISR